MKELQKDKEKIAVIKNKRAQLSVAKISNKDAPSGIGFYQDQPYKPYRSKDSLSMRGVAMLMKNFGHPVPKIHSPNATEISCDSSGVRHALAHSGRRAVASTMTLRRDAFPASPVNARLSQALQLRIASAMLSLSHRMQQNPFDHYSQDTTKVSKFVLIKITAAGMQRESYVHTSKSQKIEK